MTSNSELTTDQAAEILNVSPHFIIKLIDDRKISARMVGKCYWLRRQDVIKHQEAMQRYADKALDELAKIDNQLGLDT